MSHLELDFNRLKFLVGGTRPSQTQGSYIYIYIYILCNRCKCGNGTQKYIEVTIDD